MGYGRDQHRDIEVTTSHYRGGHAAVDAPHALASPATAVAVSQRATVEAEGDGVPALGLGI